MAIDPSQGAIADLFLRIGQLERQLETMATAPRINRSSIDGGRLTVRDGSRNDRVTIGDLGDSDYGFRIADVDGAAVFEVTEDGWTAPYWPIMLAANPAAIQGDRCRAGTDSGGYTELWRADVFSVSSTVFYDFAQYPNGGNMDWRIQVYEYTPVTFVSGAAQTVASFTSETANTQRAGSFTLPSAGLIAGSGNVKGKFWTVRVSAKMNSGTRVDVGVNAMPFFAPS